tara:strand:+ start:357 stop:578 length:222 start_codon:yes stop_codon:yes gene_type:complete
LGAIGAGAATARQVLRRRALGARRSDAAREAAEAETAAGATQEALIAANDACVDWGDGVPDGMPIETTRARTE